MDGKGDSQMDRDKQRQIGGGGGQTYIQADEHTNRRTDRQDRSWHEERQT